MFDSHLTNYRVVMSYRKKATKLFVLLLDLSHLNLLQYAYGEFEVSRQG